jgi:hypothetical protein
MADEISLKDPNFDYTKAVTTQIQASKGTQVG